MQEVSHKITELRAAITNHVTLVAVSKFHPVEAIQEAYSAGQRVFGESRADELVAKAHAMPTDTVWHFIGHVQTNKLRKIIPHTDVIESVDSERLLRLIDSEAERVGKCQRILLQVHVAAEETKTGFAPDELIEVASRCLPELKSVKVEGVMGMATNTDDETRIRSDFNAIAATSRRLQELIPEATVVSMGMSGDWPLAVECGATMVRIGSMIFGQRSY